jgi:phosphatidylethanolamine-binding protein (PEBP) family uncharacterized protein
MNSSPLKTFSWIVLGLLALAVAGCSRLTQSAEFTPKRSGHFILSSSVATNGGPLPVEFTGDGAGISPPVFWQGEPPGTKGFALVMHHIDPHGMTRCYWMLYNIPPEVHALPKDAGGIGMFACNSINRQPRYAPPHSRGPGVKTYTLTVYALAQPLEISIPPSQFNRALLLQCMRKQVLDSAELKVTCDRTEWIRRANSQSQSASRPAEAGADFIPPPEHGPLPDGDIKSF